jgi:SAM-dependent methyltransferase
MAGGAGSIARKGFRRFFPRLEDPILDAPIALGDRELRIEEAYLSALSADPDPADFRRARFREGLRWEGIVRSLAPRPPQWTLDVGGGNGAVELALNARGLRTVSVEYEWNDEFIRIRGSAGVPLRRVIARAEALPFRAKVFEAIVCLETVEHLSDLEAASREMARASVAGALLLITTPVRFRYLLSPDPHFGIRGLVALPAPLQRAVAARRGFSAAHHYVDRIYGSIPSIERRLPGFELLRVLSRSRAPKRWFWDAIVFVRKNDPAGRSR